MDSSATGQTPAGKSMLAADMWAVFNFDDPNRRYQKFLQQAKPRFTHLLDGLLLYEDVVIPTQDFVSLTVVVGVLGERAVIDLLEAGDLRFVRLRGAFAYVGNGGGVLAYEMMDENKKPLPCFGDSEEVVAWALGGLNPTPKDPTLPKRVLAKTITIDANQIKEEVRRETYMDILNSPHLRNLFAIRNTDMNRLAGIQGNQVRCYGGPDADSWKGDEIDLVLNICAANVELRIAELAKCDDASTANSIGHLLKAKADRTLGDQVPFESLMQLKEVNNVPDVASAILDKPLGERSSALGEVMKVKRSRDGAAFRNWFHANCRDNPNDVARHYIEILKATPAVSKLPARIVRFLVTSGLGLNPPAGWVASAIDGFFVDRWFRGNSPKFFIENLKQTVKIERPERATP